MRLLSIGYPLQNRDVDNYNVLTAPSYFDYDAVIIDPQSITNVAKSLVDGDATANAFDDRPVVNGITTAASVAAADQIRRRLRETEALLEQGGLVLVMARPNATQSGVIGLEGCDRYSWLPAPEGLAWSAPLLQAAEGTNVHITDDTSPAAALVREHRRNLGFRAVFDGRHPAFQRAAHIWAEARPGLPVGVDFLAMGGRICFIPPIITNTTARGSQLPSAIVDAARGLLGERARQTPPIWTGALALPGLDAAEASVSTHEQAISEATELLDDARTHESEIAIYRDLLWSDGPAFREAVRRSLVLLGFEEEGDPDSPLVVKDGDTEALVELESVGGQVAEWPYVRLQRRLDERLLKDGTLLKGIIVANGHRTTDPKTREEPLSKPLQIACENYRYSLLTAETLFELVVIALGDADAERLEGIRRRIVRGSGLMTSETLTGLGFEEGESSTLF